MLGYLMSMGLPTLMNLCGSLVSLGLTPAWLGCLYCSAAVQMGLWCECLLTLPHSGALCESPTPRVCLLSGAVRARDTWRIEHDLSTGKRYPIPLYCLAYNTSELISTDGLRQAGRKPGCSTAASVRWSSDRPVSFRMAGCGTFLQKYGCRRQRLLRWQRRWRFRVIAKPPSRRRNLQNRMRNLLRRNPEV